MFHLTLQNQDYFFFKSPTPVTILRNISSSALFTPWAKALGMKNESSYRYQTGNYHNHGKKLVLKSLSLLQCSPKPLTLNEAVVAGAKFPDGNICVSFATGKKTPGRLMAPEAGGAQTQHVQKGYHGERLGATACYQRLGFFM